MIHTKWPKLTRLLHIIGGNELKRIFSIIITLTIIFTMNISTNAEGPSEQMTGSNSTGAWLSREERPLFRMPMRRSEQDIYCRRAPEWILHEKCCTPDGVFDGEMAPKNKKLVSDHSSDDDSYFDSGYDEREKARPRADTFFEDEKDKKGINFWSRVVPNLLDLRDIGNMRKKFSSRFTFTSERSRREFYISHYYHIIQTAIVTTEEERVKIHGMTEVMWQSGLGIVPLPLHVEATLGEMITIDDIPVGGQVTLGELMFIASRIKNFYACEGSFKQEVMAILDKYCYY